MNYYIIIISLFFLAGLFYCFILASPKYIREVHGVKNKNFGIYLKVSQWILNFMGSLLGLLSLVYLLNSKFGLPYTISIPKNFSITDIIILIIMFYGLNGKLPWFMCQRWLGKNE